MKRSTLAAIALLSSSWLTAAILHAAEAKKDPHAGEVKAWDPEFNDKLYAQVLLEEIKAGRPDLDLLGIHCRPPGRTDSVIVAITAANRIGYPSNHNLDEWPAAEGFIIVEPLPAKHQYGVYLPLLDRSDRTIGTLVVKIKLEPGVPYEKYYAEGVAIRDQLKEKLGSYKDIFKRTKVWSGNDPKDPSAKIFAQQLVEEYVAKYNLVAMVFHATPPGSPNVDIASSMHHRIGVQSGPYDNFVSKGKISIIEDSPKEGIYEVAVPLLDAAESPIGCLVVQYHHDAKGDTAKYYAQTLAIRDEIKGRLPSSAELYRTVAK